jgi:hypothetical protein
MRHFYLGGILLLALWLAPSMANAQTYNNNGFSIGLILGDPTGVTLRSGLGDRSAIQAHVGFSPFPGDGLTVMLDWTYDVWDPLAGSSVLSLPLYFGVGGKAVWFTGAYYVYDHQHDLSNFYNFGLGARGLVGLRASLIQAPIDLFIEVAPLSVLVILPNPGIYYDFDSAIGIRFRF